jgi:hypothetical protein
MSFSQVNIRSGEFRKDSAMEQSEKQETSVEWLPRGIRRCPTAQLPNPRSVRFTKELDAEVASYLVQNGLSFNQLCTFAVEQFISKNQTIQLKSVRSPDIRPKPHFLED